MKNYKLKYAQTSAPYFCVICAQNRSMLGRSSRSQMFFKIGALKNFAMFTGKHLCWSLFVIKLQAARFAIKKRPQVRRFPVTIIAKF